MRDLQPVDRIEVQVLVDNATDSLSSVPSRVTREWAVLGKHGMKRLGGACLCCANHGLSLVISAYRGTERRTVLFDGGPVDYAIEENGRRLGVDFGAIDAVVLSHGHWDHAGGLPKALELIGKPVPLYLHPGMFRERGGTQPGSWVLPMDLVPTPEQFAAMGAKPVVERTPQTLLDGAFGVSGEIPRVTSYEVGLPGHMRRTEDGKEWEPDPLLMDERFLAVHLRDKGIVVFTACSHAGVVNVLTHARESFAPLPLHAVMGGLHLSGTNERVIPDTVRDLAQFGLEVIIPGHCTGWRAINALERAFGDRVSPIAVGHLFAL
jgi:7,8-dihydropterin-6-yl-methyl-4-(beta-D-ribofuranosyl)aminobenzene 5'-phosphate synthase